MKTTRKLLLALVLVMSILMTLAVAVIPASAVNANYKVIYMKPGVWNTDGAWYAVWSYSTSSNGQWAKFTDYDGDGVYSAYIPVGHTKMNLVRMNSSATTPNWNQKWNQTSDITINSNNYFTITGWNQSNYTSGTYTVASKNVCFPGAYNNWDSNTKATVSNGIATMTVKITNATTYAFKVLVGDKWYSNSGTINGSTADNGWEMSTSVSGNCNLKITETGYYSFEFHLGTGYLSVHKHTGGTATCTAKAECTICGESYGELADHTYTNYTSNGDATCTADGTKTGTCTCGAKDTIADVGSKLNHNYTNYTSNGDATCTADGTKTGTCTCGAKDTIADVGSKLNHNYTNYTSNGDATCTADGTKTGTCSCGAKDTVADVGSKLGHSEVTHEAQAPGCATIGWNAYVTCENCDYTTYKELAPTCATNAIHNEGVEAGCHTTGLKENWYCANCDVYYLDAACTIVTSYKNLVIPAANTLTQVDAKAPTCTAVGYDAYEYCSACDYTTYNEIPVDANAHYAGCGHYAVEGDSLQAALGNGSVELTKPVTVTGALTIVSGAVLDLKGQTLTADAIVTFNGAIIDTVGTGKIIVNAGNLKIAEGDYDYAPLHVETVDGKSTYVITPVKVQGVDVELDKTAIVRPSLNGQYTNKQLFADEVIAHGISFQLVVTRDNGVDEPESVALNFTEDQIKTLYSDNKHAISINLVGGLEGYTYTVELVVKSAGVQVHSTEVAILTVPVTSTTEEEGETTND